MERYKTYRFLIAGGNSTLLVEGCPLDRRESYAKKQLAWVEQVGFVEEIEGMPTMKMMGGELSINGSLAFARYLEMRKRQQSGELRTSGLDTTVKYRVNGKVTATFTLEPKVIRDKKNRDIVLLGGIGYVCRENPGLPNEDELRILASDYNLPAFGIAGFRGNQLSPDVYVKETDSLVRETACGSGSIALNMVTGARLITQPSGQQIEVLRNKSKFFVTASVERI